MLIINTNAFSKDLTGNTLECFWETYGHEEYMALHFIDKKKVKYAFVKYDLETNPKYIAVLNKGEELKYEVFEDAILIRTNRIFTAYNWWDEGLTFIDRFDLKPFRASYDGEDAYPYQTDLQCKIIDINNNDPFKIFDDLSMEEEEETKKEKKL